MKMKSIVLSLLLVTGSCFAENYGDINNVKVDSVYDGDTFTITIPKWPKLAGEKIGIRVLGVDTPEMHGACPEEIALAHKAKEFTVAFLNSGPITLKNTGRDKYFRIDADVYVNGKSLSQELIVAKLGYSYDGGTKSKWCPVKSLS